MIPGVSRQFTALAVLLTIVVILLRSSPFYRVLSEIPLDTYEYPDAQRFHTEDTTGMIQAISLDRIQSTLLDLSERFPNGRLYNSQNGRNMAVLIHDKVKAQVRDRAGASVSYFGGRRMQPSVVLRLQGQSNDTVVVGCHLDSLNLNPFDRSPGVDDDLSGVTVLLEAIETIGDLKPYNTVEFHFYAGEELGFRGSKRIMQKYRRQGRTIVAMLQQDMTGYGNNPFGLVVDYSAPSVTAFLKELISQYCDIGFTETKAGKACSDQVSALIYGYPGSYALESSMEDSNPYIHTSKDTIDLIDFDHMVEHTKLVVAFISELAHSKVNRADFHESISLSYLDFAVLLITNDLQRFAWIAVLLAASIAIVGSIVDDIASQDDGLDEVFEGGSESIKPKDV